MVDDILTHVKNTIPKEKWKDIVFVGEGGLSDDNGEIEFTGEQKHAANKFKEIGAGIDTWDGGDLDVHNDQSELYKYQLKNTGLSRSKVTAGNWASMIGQGDEIDSMPPDDYLDDEGKEFLQTAAKEAGFKPIENWQNPTQQDIDTLYRLSFPEDNNDKKTGVNDVQVAFNDARDENIIRKTKELESKGKIPIVLAGESHVELVKNMMNKNLSEHKSTLKLKNILSIINKK
jgi:hypothetical protein